MAPKRWAPDRLELCPPRKYLCAGPCGSGFRGPRAPGAPVPLSLAARRHVRWREEQLLQLQREAARKGVGIAARARESAGGAAAPRLMPALRRSIAEHLTQKWGRKNKKAGRYFSHICGARRLATHSPEGVGAVSTAFTHVPRDPQAGRGGGDMREFTSQWHPCSHQTHRSCRGIQTSHSISSAFRLQRLYIGMSDRFGQLAWVPVQGSFS